MSRSSIESKGQTNNLAPKILKLVPFKSQYCLNSIGTKAQLVQRESQFPHHATFFSFFAEPPHKIAGSYFQKNAL